MVTENGLRGDAPKKDIRVVKTHKALYDVLLKMLNHRNFNDITVNDLCAGAAISRATFYAHFNDKYSLLKYFLTEIRESIIRDVYKYDELEHEVNYFIEQNKKVITHILRYASGETLALVREFMACIVELIIKRKVDDKACTHHIILFNFLIGGLINHLSWIVENNFPPEVSMVNTYLYKLLEAMAAWDARQECG